jgi:hypothetical protein
MIMLGLLMSGLPPGEDVATDDDATKSAFRLTPGG